MKILVVAYACNPYQGSENYFGWSAIQALAQDHDLWVLTGHRSRPDIERAQAEGLVPASVRFVFAGSPCPPWHPNRMRARLQGWREYMEFAGNLLTAARALHHEHKFDVAHHVTYSTWRVASPLWQLGIPFLFGPVGGYEQFPVSLFPILSPAAALFELARMASNTVSRLSPNVCRCLRQADHVLVSNPETQALVQSVRGSANGVSLLSAAFYGQSAMESFSRVAPGKSLEGPLRLFAGGNMEGRKGIALALEALAIAKKQGVKFQYRLGAGGPEIGHLKLLAARLDVADLVEFADNLRGAAYAEELGRSHVFLLPSLRDSAGLTMMEAMLAGCVPVVVDCGGPGFIVTPECGFKIPVASRKVMVEQLAKCIITLDRQRTIIREKGLLASRRIVDHFSEEHYRATVNGIFQKMTTKARIT